MPTMLVVDRSEEDRRLVEQLVGAEEGWQVLLADTSASAIELIERESPDIVATNLDLPDREPLAFVEQARRDYPRLPLLLLTAPDNEEMALKALQQGAVSYIPKQAAADTLMETAQTILSITCPRNRRTPQVECVGRDTFRFVLANDFSQIPPLVVFLQDKTEQLGLCGAADRMRVGVALDEALINALFHGNLEIDSRLRDEDHKAYADLLKQRLSASPYKHRRIHVEACLTSDDATFVVRDEGPGFDPDNLPDPTDPANLEKVSGRGVMLMRSFMDEVTYNRRGNEVTMIKRAAPRQFPNRGRPMSEPLYFALDNEENCLIVIPLQNIGSLADEEVSREWNEVLERLRQTKAKHVVFDFHQLSYFGSSMLEAMLVLWKRIHADGGKMAICHASDTVLEILELAKFNTIWPVYDSRADALAAVASENQ